MIDATGSRPRLATYTLHLRYTIGVKSLLVSLPSLEHTPPLVSSEHLSVRSLFGRITHLYAPNDSGEAIRSERL